MPVQTYKTHEIVSCYLVHFSLPELNDLVSYESHISSAKIIAIFNKIDVVCMLPSVKDI